MRQGLQYHIDLIDGSFGRGMAAAEKQTRGLDSAMSRLNNAIRAGAAALLGNQIFQIGEQAVLTGTRIEGMERAIRFTGGKDGAANLQFVRDQAQRLGLDLMAAEKGYTVLSGAMMGNATLAKSQNDIYQGVSMAMTALNRDTESFEGSLLAISQMASKGTVSAEELRGQLGERLPGAFGIAARAMGMTEAQLGKAMQKGEVMASEFLPRFARELQNTFGPEAEKNSNSFVAQMNRNTTAMLDQKRALGSALQPAYLKWQELKVTGMGLLADTAQWMSANKDGLTALATGIGVAALAYGTMVGLQKASAMWSTIEYTYGLIKLAMVEANTLGLTGMAAAQHALNVAMNANPIGMIITGLGLLAAGIVYAWEKSETFRASLKGIWAVVTELIEPVMGLGKAMIGLVTFNPAMLKSGLSDAAESIRNMDLGKAFNSAFDAEINASKEKEKGLPAAAAATAPTSMASGGSSGTGVKGAGSVAAGNSVRNVNVTIQNLVRELVVHTGNMKSNESQIRREIERLLISATRDYEQALD